MYNIRIVFTKEKKICSKWPVKETLGPPVQSAKKKEKTKQNHVPSLIKEYRPGPVQE